MQETYQMLLSEINAPKPADVGAEEAEEAS